MQKGNSSYKQIEIFSLSPFFFITGKMIRFSEQVAA